MKNSLKKQRPMPHRAALLGSALVLAFSVSHPVQAAEPFWRGWEVSLEGGPSFMSGTRNVFSQDTTLTLPSFDASQKDREIGPKTGASGKIALRYRWGVWDAGISYRGTFSAENNEGSDLTGNVAQTGVSTSFPVYPGLIDPGIGIILSPFGFAATATSRSTTHSVDVDAGYNRTFKWGEIRLIGGLRFVRTHTSMSVRMNILDVVGFDIDRKSSYWGVGPKLGAQFTVPLGKEFDISGAVQGAILLGNRKTSESIGANLAGLGRVSTQTEENGGLRTAFSMDADIALTYRPTPYFFVSLGYGVQSLWGGMDNRHVDTLASFVNQQRVVRGTSAGVQINHGPFLRVGLRWGG